MLYEQSEIGRISFMWRPTLIEQAAHLRRYVAFFTKQHRNCAVIASRPSVLRNLVNYIVDAIHRLAAQMCHQFSLHSANTSWSVTSAAVNVFADTTPSFLASLALSTVRS